MIAFLKNKWKFLVVIVFIAVILIFGIERFAHHNLSFTLNKENLSYVICYSRGLGPKKLNYSEYQELLDEIMDMVSGQYHCVGKQNNNGKSGGGPDSIILYNADGTVIDKIYYKGDDIYMPSEKDGIYYIYENEDKKIDFSKLEECLDLQ